MQKKEIITITGTIGSGKSSVADKIAEKLGYRRFSSGDFMRKIALDMGLTLNELSLQAQTSKGIDLKIDEEVKKAGELDKIVIDSRLAFHWIPKSFKVYLDLPPEIAKERILKNLKENKLRQESEHATTPEEVYGQIRRRRRSEEYRYMKLYGVNHTDHSNFDLVIDTNKNDLNQVVDIIVREYKKWREKIK
ncbi:hypothetical protein A2917_02435 [Candidatus Nomurabacteria bacterium RIFCSPLOWO2_01_FULL_42_17]|uniref:Uncharacterized protein n=1 Tax=Candidatus Nomurabacteria bacterium RIFCSPLOWO2_01_FULL_42_17 TaxID=1801780 RepID=A0A1F6XMM3_9BACT|nr:MAG: hypothetical protein A2917_02435 [Candidatus Nomurabacteria bacterium RIFCSPLOWO2_01_FULL_42_17]